MPALSARLRGVSRFQYWSSVRLLIIRYRQNARLATHPRVNSSAHTVLPEEAGETPRDSAAAITFPPNAIPTLGRHESMPAKTAMARPTLNAFDGVPVAWLAEGVLREPAMEHSTIPKITSAVPASNTKPLPVRRACGKNTSSGIRAPRLAMSPMMMG